jgi:2-phospho-L-lactate guanylyltransferase (CobY/MobA/RfbA family)
MAFPTNAPLRASYGRSSFSRHLEQASAIQPTALEVRADPELALDLDTEHDLAHPLISEVLPEWLPTILANPAQP